MLRNGICVFQSIILKRSACWGQSADGIVIYFLTFFPEKSNVDNLPGISKPTFWENKKHINKLSSSEYAHRVVKLTYS